MKIVIDPVEGRGVFRAGGIVPDAGVVAQSVLEWNGGKALHERQVLRDDDELRFASDHHALFFSFRQPESKGDIQIDGQLLLNGFSSDPRLTILPAGMSIVKNGGSGGLDDYDCLSIRLSHEFVLRAADAEHLRGIKIRPSIGFGDELSWQLASAIRDECEAGSPGGTLFVEMAAKLLALLLLRHHSNIGTIQHSTVKGGLSQHQLRTAIDYLTTHLAADTSLGQLASLTGLSESHFCRAFKASTGLAPYQWRMQRRIERGKELLENTTIPLAEIALACGFANQSHFTKAFRDAVGASPAAWRRERLA